MNPVAPAPLIIPDALKPGDTIAICSPAGPVSAAKVHAAEQILRSCGYNVRIAPHALGQHGNYSGSADERYSDFAQALTDPSVKAILCSRGGYGVVHIMERLADIDLRANAKWVIGFSDISAMHALLSSRGIASVHSPMAAHIARGAEDPDTARLLGIMQGLREPVSFDPHPLDRPGTAHGTLLGGNLAVLADLINTPYDILQPDTILFIEDVAEPIYKIERIMYQLRIANILPRLKGLIVGQFTEYKPDASYHSMEQMIYDMTAPYSYPIAFGVPVGHVDHNIPLIESAKVTLKVTPNAANHLIYW